MDLDTANNPAPDEAPELASEETPEPAPETEFADGEQPDAEPEIEYAEVERNGKRFKIPKELESELLMQADYTRKTQEAADLRKQAQADREAVVRERQVYDELSEEISAVRWIDKALQNLQQVDYRQLSPEQKTEYALEMQRLTTDRQMRIGQIEGRKQELEQRHAQNVEQTLRQAVAELAKPDPRNGWAGKFDPQTSKELTKFALDVGFNLDEVKNTNHPVMIKVLNLAKIGRSHLDQQRSTPARPQAQPAAKVPTAKAQVMPSDPAKWSVQQMAKHLKASKVI